MDQNQGNTPFDTGVAGSAGTGSMGASSSTGTESKPIGVTSATESAATCPHCGQSMNRGGGLEQFLGRLGIDDEMINNLKGQFQNVDVDEYLNTAREYLKNSSGKASTFAKENPGKVAAGLATLALGAGLIYAATNRDK